MECSVCKPNTTNLREELGLQTLHSITGCDISKSKALRQYSAVGDRNESAL